MHWVARIFLGPSKHAQTTQSLFKAFNTITLLPRIFQVHNTCTKNETNNLQRLFLSLYAWIDEILTIVANVGVLGNKYRDHVGF